MKEKKVMHGLTHRRFPLPKTKKWNAPKKMYLVTFVPSLDELEKVTKVMDGLAKADDTFSYDGEENILTFEDEDKKRAFRRGMWIKRALEKKDIELDFSFSHYTIKPKAVDWKKRRGVEFQ